MQATYTEAAFTQQVLDLAKLHRWKTAHFRPARTKDGWRTAVSGDGKGWPDLVMVKGPWIVVAELKVGKGKPTPEQEAWLEAFKAVGYVWTFIWRPSDWAEIEWVISNGPVLQRRRRDRTLTFERE